MTPSTPLAPSAIAAVQQSLAEALEMPSGLDEGGLADALRALEELVCTATAAQAALSVELDELLRGAAAAAGVPADDQSRGVGHVVAQARRESPHRGRRHLALAKVATAELPHTWSAWRAGRVTEWAVTVIARETACVSLEHRWAIDAAVAADPDAVESMGIGELTGRVRSMAEELDPEAAVQRRRRAESERCVSLRPAPDTMTWLTALLPVKEGVAVLASLSAAADTAWAGGDGRTRGQLMADTLVDSVLGRSEPAAQDQRPRSGVRLNLVVSDHALFGHEDAPAHLDGFGAIPAELAREILREALTSQEKVWLQRLYADPDTEELVTGDARARLFPRSMARFIRLRDQICRTPWCDAPIRHADHVEPHARGGSTALANAQGLCESCNQAKQAYRWRSHPRPDGSVATTHPTGTGHLTRAPRWSATIHERRPPLSIDYYLTA